MKLYKKFYHVAHQDTVVRDCDDPLVRGIILGVSQDSFFLNSQKLIVDTTKQDCEASMNKLKKLKS